ncbi:PAS domain S-box protein [Pseudoalteromonas luteoviolacea]|uniref:Sensor protein FixL n=1 Tax=Pseudoalteromonas luteoviolacea S4054 TaxID=1129367 RepID=A0A0F6A606_9GAMM|nr:PAS domain S-box protein [Pseudoalteromonas luteoviolacea]AOT08153.1 hybrid sensor histidine kinase/response regulator [Pseudoalteromonas luteoviolacea]AOT13070.1 hybrid sensor histidine kinase/response regulator [Pseudoalteromonas luteoviolacea]AOT17982.1 hybrid sensor histidine kinase/response regulator [Pseudoalteromonas luteoviolacea]KKE81647.1 hypothetical protein N479_21740 [Pseudoalteromonas luteoviolacea S4054]KZN69480.1 hypothetical protein N481_22070 [Pseudoalteromonas luteoviolac
MKLSQKLPLLFFAFGIIMLAAVVSVSWKGRAILQETTLSNIEREAILLIRLIERNLFERYHDAQAFPLSLGLDSKDNLKQVISDPRIIENLNNFVQNYKVYRRIIVMSPNGEVLVTNSKNRYGKVLTSSILSPAEIREKKWFIDALNGKTLTPEQPQSSFVIGPNKFLIDKNDNSYDMIFATTLKNSQQEVIGLWVNVVDFAAVENIVAETYTILSERGFVSAELTILDSEGRIIVDYDPVGQNEANYQRDFNVLDNLNLAQNGVEGARLAVSGLSGSNISTHFRKQVEQVTGYAHTAGAYDYSGLGWSALIRLSVDEAFVESEALFQRSFLIAAVLLSIILVVAFLLSKQMGRPLRELSFAIQKLAKGEKNIKLPEVYGKDEIALMASELKNLKRIVVDRDKLSRETDEQRFQLDIQSRAIDSTATGIIVTDARQVDLPVIYSNKAFEELTGYTSEEILGKNCRFLQGEDTEQPEIEVLHKAIKNQRSCSVVIRNYKKDGTLFYNNLRVDPVFNDQGVLSHYIGVQTDITELKTAEDEVKVSLEREIEKRTQEARESENRLRTVFDTALDGTVVIDKAGIILDVNRSLEVIFGRVREELLGENLSILMPPEYANQHDEFISKYILTGNKKLIGSPREVMGLHKSGRTFPIEVSVGETWIGDTQVFVGIVKDITVQEETKAREIELKNELEEREVIYHAAFSQAAVGICRVALDGRFIEVNEKMCDIFELSESEILSLNYKDLTHPEDRSQSKTLVQDLVEGKQRSFTLDKRYVNNSGKAFWATTSVSLVSDADNVAKYMIAVVEDITSRKAIEEELRAAKVIRDDLLRGMRIASDAGGICNWSLNIQTKELKWDNNMFDLHGIDPEQLMDFEQWQEVFHPEDAEKTKGAYLRAISEKSVLNAEYRIVNKLTGGTHWVKAAADINKDEETGREILFGINLDITDERLINKALEKETAAAMRANEAKSRFLATMSHEIRTPMNGVIGMVDLLKETQLTSEQNTMISTIRDSSFSLLEIINDILDFSKIESGQMELESTEVNVLNLIEKTLEALWVNANQKGVNLFLLYDYKTPEFIRLDPVRTRQILLNLLGNAVKFSQRDDAIGNVSVGVAYNHKACELEIVVKDNGIGMTNEQIGKLFKPFTQADSSTTRKYGGTGLGLSITNSFVNLMGGQIDVESKIGIGSQFSIRIPAEADSLSNEFDDYNFNGVVFELKFKNAALEQTCEHLIQSLQGATIRKNSKEHSNSWVDDKVITICDELVEITANSGQKWLVLEDNHTKPKGVKDAEIYIVGSHPLKASEFITGLAILSGQESPEFDWSESFYGHDEDMNEDIHPEFADCVILCAEDQPTNQLVLSQQLTTLGYKFEMTSNGLEALRKWESGHFSLLLTDCHMPKMDGFELTSEIRRLETELNRPRTTIVAVTANALVGEAEHCLEAGMDDYIAKPVELKTLRNTLALRLRGMALRQEATEEPEINEIISSEPCKLIDYEHLWNVIGCNDEEMTRAVLSMFWESVSKDIETIKEAVATNNLDNVKSLAHGAKGAAASSGALGLSELLKSIEKNSNDLKYLESTLVDVHEMMGELEQQLVKENII